MEQPLTTNSSAANVVDAPPTPPAGGNGLAALLTLLAVCWYLYTRHRDAIFALYNRARAILGVGEPTAAAMEHAPEKLDTPEPPSVDPAMVLRKLKALNARLYGVQSCGWTVRQLEVFGTAKAAAREIYVDCAEASESDACAKVSHFPTWEIKGKMMPPGMVALEVLNAQCDSMLVVAMEKMKAAKEEDDDASQLQTPPPSSPSKPPATDDTTVYDDDADSPAEPAEQDDEPNGGADDEPNGEADGDDTAFAAELKQEEVLVVGDDEAKADEQQAVGELPEPEAGEQVPEPSEPAETKPPTPEPAAKKPRRRRKRG